MTTAVEILEQSVASPWRTKSFDDLDLREVKRPCRPCHFRLASESSKASEDEAESIYSMQGKETDVVIDTSDTESDSDFCRYSLVLDEYDVASLSDNSISEISSDSVDLILKNDLMAAAAAVICDSSLDGLVTVTDVEDSDSSSDGMFLTHMNYNICVQCKERNKTPLFTYCDKCFQDRKKLFPPRPKKKRSKRKNSTSQEEEKPVKLDTLKDFLSNLSQDSGVGYTQEIPELDFDQIVVPGCFSISDSKECEKSLLSNQSETEEKHSVQIGLVQATEILKGHSAEFNFSEKEDNISRAKCFKRRRSSSESTGLSESEIKKARFSPKASSDIGSEASLSSFASTQGLSMCSESSGYISGKSSETIEKRSTYNLEKTENDICMFCYSAPKDSIFLHTNIAHRCCCYNCAKKTLKMGKRCPICNRTVNKVVKIFTS
ncbi:hypothetical protein ABEB36_015589 [Hypothenemus hampei]|uniref:Uncharacterized protein n=1 Tax=Hypothenemus hampei TaxID=57062 RepID=A0ABD1DZN5_HYPHA